MYGTILDTFNRFFKNIGEGHKVNRKWISFVLRVHCVFGSGDVLKSFQLNKLLSTIAQYNMFPLLSALHNKSRLHLVPNHFYRS